MNLALTRGRLIRGKVTEEGGGQPVADAMVNFNPYARSEGLGWALTGDDGSFAFAVGPHPGHLSIQGPARITSSRRSATSQFYEGQGGGLRVYSHAFLPCDPRPGTEPLEVNVALRRAPR